MDVVIEPTGGVELGGHADGEIEFIVTKEFSFNSGQCIPYYWQVFGKCEKYSCLVWSPRSGLQEVVPEGGPTTDDCNRTLSITIQACSIVELCRELSSQGFQFTIDRIYKYTRPALERDQYLWDGCGAFVEIYPNLELGEEGLPPECLLFLIRETIKDDWGINFQVEFICNIDGEGGLDVGGEADDISANVYFIDGEGGLDVGESIYNFVGTFDNVIKTQSEILDFEVQMKESQGSVLVASDDLVSAACDCGPYLLLVNLIHNLNDCDKLKFFLDKNGFILPSLINLAYNNRTYAWQSNFHFKGYGESDSLETWDFVFEWGCTDEIGMITVDKIWKFGIYIKQRIISTNERFDTKILLAINPIDACNNGQLRCSFALNTELETINTTTSDLNINANLNVCYDNIGIFGAPSWLKDPVLDISVYQQGSPQGQSTFSINPILPESVIFG